MSGLAPLNIILNDANCARRGQASARMMGMPDGSLKIRESVAWFVVSHANFGIFLLALLALGRERQMAQACQPGVIH